MYVRERVRRSSEFIVIISSDSPECYVSSCEDMLSTVCFPAAVEEER